MQYLISFLEGVITFISPCLLPMLPIYISYFAGGGERTVKKTLSGADLKAAIEGAIRAKGDLAGSMASQGTTPRRLTDLIGSLCDLTSGSGDKGTPIIHIQGYFDNYTN